jgi:UDP-glucose 4-epimerase
MTRWLLTGGAGYIGCHVTRELLAAGTNAVIVDDLSTGMASRVPDDVPLVVGDVADTDLLVKTMRAHDVDGVMHFAAKKAVGESVERPLYYYQQNIDGLLSVLEAMARARVARIVYSSSAAVYGEPDLPLITEADATVPTNPYGETKLFGELAVRAQARAEEIAKSPISFVLMRYFNVAGAGSPELGDPSVANLIPLALQAVDRGERPKIFGSDYPTPDGTCVRDYIHVLDLAAAHVAAVDRCQSGVLGSVQATYNVGRGRGSSVREVLDIVSDVVGFDVDPIDSPRRSGDPASLVADPSRIATELGWEAKHDVREMIRSSWAARNG